MERESTFELADVSSLLTVGLRSAFAVDQVSTLRRIGIEEGAERSTAVSFRQTRVEDPFDPSVPPADVRITARFVYGGEVCEGLELAVTAEDLAGGWIAVRAESGQALPGPDLGIPRTRISDPKWNTFIRTGAPAANLEAELTLFLWPPEGAATRGGSASMELDLLVPAGKATRVRARERLAGQTADAFGQPAATAHDLQVVGAAVLEVGPADPAAA
jgi:hypothetical protein